VNINENPVHVSTTEIHRHRVGKAARQGITKAQDKSLKLKAKDKSTRQKHKKRAPFSPPPDVLLVCLKGDASALFFSRVVLLITD
jgi:hypothetical protein